MTHDVRRTTIDGRWTTPQERAYVIETSVKYRLQECFASLC